MFENLRLAFRGIWTHKLRSFLTMLGIIIGIAAIIAIVSTIEGTNQQIKENLIGSGSNAVDIAIFQGEWEYEFEWSGIPEGVSVISDETIKEIKDLKEVKNVSRYNKRNVFGNVFYKDKNLTTGFIKGVEPDYFETANFSALKGRLFTKDDEKKFRRVCVVDESIMEELFNNENPIGEIIEVDDTPYTIVGVVASRSTFEPVINTIEDYALYHQDDSGTIYIPHADWAISYCFDEPENIMVQAKSTDDMTAAGKKATDILNKKIHPEDETLEYKSKDLLEQAMKLQQLTKSTNSMLIWIAAISLLVGGIGVMNIMLVSVTERTSEIGLKKAIGARKSKVMWQFLTEAAVLTSLGGFLGVASGIGLARIISIVAGTPVAISWPAAIVAVIFSTVIGVVFGIIPSHQAANLNPIDALRSN